NGMVVARCPDGYYIFDPAAPDRPARLIPVHSATEAVAWTAEGLLAVATKPRPNMVRVGFLRPEDGKEVRFWVREEKRPIRYLHFGAGARRLALYSEEDFKVVEVVN